MNEHSYEELGRPATHAAEVLRGKWRISVPFCLTGRTCETRQLVRLMQRLQVGDHRQPPAA